MKKKTALTLSLFALLGAGTGLSINNKQKKDFEKKLKTVLIPDAEKKFDSLQHKNNALNDSIIKYQDAVALQNQKLDSVRNVNAPSYAARHQCSGINGIYELPDDFGEIYCLTLGLYTDWFVKTYKVLRQDLGNNETEANGIWDKEVYSYNTNISKDTLKMYEDLYHLVGNGSNFFPRVLGYQGDFVLEHPVSVPNLELISTTEEEIRENDKSVCKDVMTYDTKDLDDFFSKTICGIRNTVCTSDVSFLDFYEAYAAKNTHVGLKLAVLRSLLSFTDAVDNSQEVFCNIKLRALDAQVKALLPIIETEYVFAQKKDSLSEKLNAFKSEKDETEKLVSEQAQKLHDLKTKDIRKLMKENRSR